MKSSVVIISFVLIAWPCFAQDWMSSRYFQKGVPQAQALADSIKFALAQSEGTSAAELVFQRFDNSSWDSLSSFRGKVVLINLWQSGCPPCIAEIPDLNKVQSEFAGQGFVLLSITPEDSTALERFFAIRKVRFSGILATMPYANYAPPFQCMGNPTGVIIDRSGIIRRTWMGAQTYDSLKTFVAPILFRH